MTQPAALQALDQIVGTWTTRATHPMLPGVIVHGTAVMEWLEGERFLMWRARNDHPQFPASTSIIGLADKDRVAEGADDSASSEALTMHYFDSRGVFRVYRFAIDSSSLRFWRDAPGFSQRFKGTFADRNETIVVSSQACEDDVHWADDIEITYRRAKS
jgi:hypothetical protein